MSDLTNIYKMSDKEFSLFQKLIYDNTGIFLNEAKKMLAISRLAKRLKQLNIKSYSDYYDYLNNSKDKETELINMINRITTNKTDFFRENYHFEYLRDVIFPKFKTEKKEDIKIWSAGCSTGEEPYTIAMEVINFFGIDHKERIKILATDLDTEVLGKAERGIYSAEKISKIPKEYLLKYMKKIPKNEYEVEPFLKSLISFKRFNLMSEQYPFHYGFDIIFCRNVVIYFSREDRVKFFKKAEQNIRGKGYLFLGHSESLLNLDIGLKLIKKTIYKKI